MNDPVIAYILRNDALPPAERESNVAIARRFGIGETSVRRRRKRIRKMQEENNLLPVGGRDPMFGIPADAVLERKRTTRHADGSYDIIRFKPGAVEQAEARHLSYDDLKDLDVPPYERPEEPVTDTLVICLSDFQVGKQDERGGSKESVERIVKMLNAVAQDVIAKGGYTEIILADLGDSTEGFGNVTSQQQTNDLSLTDQIRMVTRLFAEAIRLLAPACERLWFVSVPSNHCAVRTGTGSKNRANAPDDDFGILIHDNLKMWAEDRESLSHVLFAAPQKWEEALTVETHDGTCVGFTHGHLAGSHSKVGKWFGDLAFGHRSGLHEASILVHGHFHTFRIEYVGDSRTVIGAPSTDNGSSWFTNTSGKSSPSELLTFEVQGGFSKNWKLYRD